jgi:hypothetical protein
VGVFVSRLLAGDYDASISVFIHPFDLRQATPAQGKLAEQKSAE